MPTPVTTTLRDRNLRGIVTTSDLVPISRLLMTPDEQAIMLDPTNPDPILAGELIQSRLQRQLDELTEEHGGGEHAKDRANEIITQEWIKRLMVVCESDLELRTLILTRILEIFPDIPGEWMWYDRNTGLAGHRLEFDELLLDLILVIYAAVAAADGESSIKARMDARSKRGVSIKALAEGLPTPAVEVPQPVATVEAPAPVAPAAPATPGIDVATMSNSDRMMLLEQLKAATADTEQAGLLNQLKTK